MQPSAALASRASRSPLASSPQIFVRTYISLHRSLPCRQLHPPAMNSSSSASSSSWFILPVEIQQAITHHLDIKTLLSLSLVSHHNYTLCLPAVYNVRCPVVSHHP